MDYQLIKVLMWRRRVFCLSRDINLTQELYDLQFPGMPLPWKNDRFLIYQHRRIEAELMPMHSLFTLISLA